ncbi:MAG: response regulator, partial [Candidatus Kapaibacterium sp.]
GLGLAIAKQLVEAQGGTLNVDSKLTVGSTFSFILGFKKTNAKAEAEIAEEIKYLPENSGIRVLVAEDIALNQLLMKTLLEDYGFNQDIAGNGKIAIEKLQERHYDIILMDLQMPEMNGFETTHYIRNSMKSKIPIIALTADVTTADIEKCKTVGMDDYIAKPVDERALYNKIMKLLKKSGPLNESPDAKDQKDLQKPERCTDLYYLNQRTKANPVLMMEMIKLYLDQTPMLVSIMKESLEKSDWTALYAAVHKIIPSFSIMGISRDFENIAKKIQEYASAQVAFTGIEEMFLKIESVCTQACRELEEEVTLMKNKQAETL